MPLPRRAAVLAADFIEAILFGMSAQARDGASREQLLEIARRAAAASLEEPLRPPASSGLDEAVPDAR